MTRGATWIGPRVEVGARPGGAGGGGENVCKVVQCAPVSNKGGAKKKLVKNEGSSAGYGRQKDSHR